MLTPKKRPGPPLRRTEAALLAREGEQVLVAAAGAPDAGDWFCS